MTILGQVKVTEHYKIGRLEFRSYEWEGPAKCEVTHDLLFSLGLNEDCDIIIGPYRLKFIEHIPYRGVTIYVRKDYPLWWLVYFVSRLTPKIDLFYRRLIITLAVWNLADYSSTTIPCWRDIKIVKRLRTRI